MGTTQLVLGERPPAVKAPPAKKNPCPDCGHELRNVVTLIGPVYYADEYCDVCGYTNLDDEGGI